MSRRVRILFCAVAGIMTVVCLAIVGWVAIHGRDIAPVDTSDLAVEVIQVSDANNADICLRQAFQSFQWPQSDRAIEAIVHGETWDEALVGDLLARNAPTLALLKQGLARPAYQGLDGRGPNDLSPLLRLRMSQLLVLEAARERRAGHKDEAWGAARGLLRFGSLIAAHPTSAIDCMAGMVALERGFEQTARLLHDIPLDEPRLVSISEALSHTVPLEQAWTRAIKREHAFMDTLIDKAISPVKSKHPVVGSYMFQPNRIKADYACLYRTLIRNLSCPYAEMDLPEAAESPAVSFEGLDRFLTLLRPNGMLKVVLPRADYLNNRVLVGRCRTQAHRDGLRLVVACRVYEIRHGQLPENLEGLVPGLLRAVPRDPFDGQPFRYSREEAVVYSVGKDLTDSWILGEHAPDALLSSRTSRKTDDLVHHLIVPSGGEP